MDTKTDSTPPQKAKFSMNGGLVKGLMALLGAMVTAGVGFNFARIDRVEERAATKDQLQMAINASDADDRAIRNEIAIRDGAADKWRQSLDDRIRRLDDRTLTILEEIRKRPGC